jgi:hypothetical protein
MVSRPTPRGARSPTRNGAGGKAIGCLRARARVCREPDAAGHRAGQDGGLDRAPEIGINNTPLDYEYVRLNRVLYHKMNLGPGVRRTPHPNSPASPWIARTTRAAP